MIRLSRGLIIATSLILVGGFAQELPPKPEVRRPFTYNNDRVRSVPWSVHVVKIDRSRTNLALVTTLGGIRDLGVGSLTEQVRGIPPARGRPLVAINGDFFREYGPYSGDARGLQILDGELVSAPDGKACFWIDAQGLPHLGKPASRLKATWPSGETVTCGLNEERRGNTAVLYTSRIGPSTGTSGGREVVLEQVETNLWLPLRPGLTYTGQVRQVRDTGDSRVTRQTLVLSLGPALATRLPALAKGALVQVALNTAPDLTGARTGLGGGPILVRQGRPQPVYDHKSDERHPREAVGWNADSFFLVAVDGRQHDLSAGMTLEEFADYLARLGCDEAMNLDGGASVELWVLGRIMNSPCAGHERQTANGLVLLDVAHP